MNGRNLKGQGATIRTGQLSAAERDGIRIGARVRLREAAKAALESAADVAAATGRPIDFDGGWSAENGDRFTLAEARDLLAAAPPRYAPIMDRERMADRDLLAIATAAASATAAAINRKVGRAARLTDDEYSDLRAYLLLKAAEAGAPEWRAIEGVAEAEAAAATMTRAERIDSLRGRWIGYLILHGRAWRRERAERMATEASAEAAEAEAALLAEGQRIVGREAAEGEAREAAEAARRTRDGMAEVAAAVATVAALAARLEAAAPLGKAERMALEAALLGLSRRELAERYGHSADYVKTTLRRGRAALAERWPSAEAARRDVATVAAATVEAERAALVGTDRTRDVLRWAAEAAPMVGALVEAAWRAPMARPTTEAAERVSLPRAARGLLPVIPYRTATLPRMGWAQATEAALAAQEARATVAASERKRPTPSRTGDRDGRTIERDRIRRATARAEAARLNRAARIATTRRRRAAAALSGYPGRTNDLAAYIG